MALTFDQLVVPLEHFHYDVFRSAKGGPGPNPLESARVTFAYGANGKVESLTVPLEPGVPEPIIFKRKRETAATSSARQ